MQLHKYSVSINSFEDSSSIKVGGMEKENFNISFYTKLDEIIKFYFENYDELKENNHQYNCDFYMVVMQRLGITELTWDIYFNKLIADNRLKLLMSANYNHFVMLTISGKEFWDNGNGGYINKHKKELADEKRRVDLEQSIIDTNKLLQQNQKNQEDTNATTRRIAWFSIIVAGISAVGTLGQWLLPLSKEDTKQDIKVYHHCCDTIHFLKHNTFLQTDDTTKLK